MITGEMAWLVFTVLTLTPLCLARRRSLKTNSFLHLRFYPQSFSVSHGVFVASHSSCHDWIAACRLYRRRCDGHQWERESDLTL